MKLVDAQLPTSSPQSATPEHCEARRQAGSRFSHTHSPPASLHLSVPVSEFAQVFGSMSIEWVCMRVGEQLSMRVGEYEYESG